MHGAANWFPASAQPSSPSASDLRENEDWARGAWGDATMIQRTHQVGTHSISMITLEVGPSGSIGEEGERDTTGFALWPSSTLVSGLLLQFDALELTDVLDLGTGSGFCGIVASYCHARSVVLSDREPSLRYLARRNVKLQPVSRIDRPYTAPTVESFGWGEGDSRPDVPRGFGLILASDVLYTDHFSTRYDPEMLERFVRLLVWCLTPGGTVLIGHVERNCMGLADVCAVCVAHGFAVEVLDPDECIEASVLDQCGNAGVRSAKVVRLTTIVGAGGVLAVARPTAQGIKRSRGS